MILPDKLKSDLLKKCDLRAIVAMAQNGVIGVNNTLPWKIPEELQFFQKTTLNDSVLMGRKTFQSIGKLLPNRKNIILTRSDLVVEGAIIIHNVSEILNVSGTIWVCGGASIYQLLLPACRELYLSIIHTFHSGDTFFPDYKSLFTLKDILINKTDFHVERMINKLLA